jgi:hypothetical protein
MSDDEFEDANYLLEVLRQPAVPDPLKPGPASILT